jgi:CheY-like chemotaxis protein
MVGRNGLAMMNFKNKHVLVADDEKHTRLAISLVLRKSGFKVSVADNGLDALARVQGQESFDLLVVDVQMPGLTGPELIGELEKINLELPILMISGYRDSEVLSGLLMKGCVDYLEKPFEPEQFMSSVEKVLERFAGGPAKSAKRRPVPAEVAVGACKKAK